MYVQADLPRTLSGCVGAVEGVVAVNDEREPALVPIKVQHPLACADSEKPPAQPERPKPRQVSKNTQHAIQDDTDAFSLRKQPLQAPSASTFADTGVSRPSVSSGVTPPLPQPVIQRRQGDEEQGEAHDSGENNQSSAKEEGVAARGAATVGVSGVTPIVSRGSGGQADTEPRPGAPSNVAAAVEGSNKNATPPCPPGWPAGFGPPGSGQFPGYLFPPFGGWGMFPGQDTQGTRPAVGSGDEQAAQQAAAQAAYLRALLNLHSQQFPFPIPNAPSAGNSSSEAGNAVHGEGAERLGGDAK